MANARPHSAAATIASSAPAADAGRADGISATATATDPAATRTRTPTHNRWPMTRSTARSGVAAMAWYTRSHLNPPNTGHVLSIDPMTIAVEASRPGAMKWAYPTPPRSAADDVLRSTSEPTPRPVPRR